MARKLHDDMVCSPWWLRQFWVHEDALCIYRDIHCLYRDTRSVILCIHLSLCEQVNKRVWIFRVAVVEEEAAAHREPEAAV